ncbi:Transcriptional regulator, LysR family [Labilithrix luteola]|uniref:Transcriptional regulator, LysR family n=2 Tax=Labilithrix luteola TaxID=1391654 RepID=A0A0K1Q126_9BACT|nr:Transcriptional regulator, LysR family [Labilithrix luteola]
MHELDLNDVATFVEVVQAGSFSQAARRLASPKSTVSRRVARLERALSVRLMHRTTRSLALTAAGKSYYERAAAALGQLHAAGHATEAQQESARGSLRVSAPTDIGSEVLPRICAAFSARYPDVYVEVELSPRAPDFISGGYDLGIRAGRQTDSSLVVRKLQEMTFRLYAAPSYLAEHGTPKSAAALKKYPCVLFKPKNGSCRWRLRGARLESDVIVTGRVGSDDISFVRRATVAGAGIGLLPDLVGAHLVAAGELIPVLPDLWAVGPALFVVTPSSEHLPLRVRVFRDFLVEHFPQPGTLRGYDLRGGR